MKSILGLLLLVVAAVGPARADKAPGTIVIYRQWGARVGFMHYAQGEHPTVTCDFTKVAKMSEGRKITISAVVGTHTCSANEKQYPGELNADSDTVSVDVSSDSTVYLRLLCRFGRVHFVLEKVPEETAQAEMADMKPVSAKDAYATQLTTNSEKAQSK